MAVVVMVSPKSTARRFFLPEWRRTRATTGQESPTGEYPPVDIAVSGSSFIKYVVSSPLLLPSLPYPLLFGRGISHFGRIGRLRRRHSGRDRPAHPLRNIGLRNDRGNAPFFGSPNDAQNQIIADLALAPTDPSGGITFSSDFRLLSPKDGAKPPLAVWAEIPNRGGKSNLQRFMIDHHFALFEVGWEFDVASDPKRLSIEVPKAVEMDGSPIRGAVENFV